MKIIETNFIDKHFSFKQIAREGDFAVYERQQIPYMGHNSDTVHWEVIKIQKHNGYSFVGKTWPPSEFYPRNADWGLYGFTCQTKERAYKKLDEMVERDKLLGERKKRV